MRISGLPGPSGPSRMRLTPGRDIHRIKGNFSTVQRNVKNLIYLNYPSACVRNCTNHLCADVCFGAHANSILLLALLSAFLFGADANSLQLLALLSARENTKVHHL